MAFLGEGSDHPEMPTPATKGVNSEQLSLPLPGPNTGSIMGRHEAFFGESLLAKGVLPADCRFVKAGSTFS